MRCAEYILSKNNVILGVISADKSVTRWANDKGVNIVSFEDFKARTGTSTSSSSSSSATATTTTATTPLVQYDYLFSIFNNRILDNAVLSSPRKGAINCHDAPLPKYGGVNAVAWALMNQENSHGVTWHIMQEQIDEGEILQQAIFNVCTSVTTCHGCNAFVRTICGVVFVFVTKSRYMMKEGEFLAYCSSNDAHCCGVMWC